MAALRVLRVSVVKNQGFIRVHSRLSLASIRG
jgi:hypothetical protein